MNIIKLNATASTNTFLKELSDNQSLTDFTIVVTENQLEGKGQRGNMWQVESGKNLTFSVLINNFQKRNKNIFVLNILVALAIVDVLKDYQLPDLKIKWPNDILSEKKKIGGILIENSFKGNNEILSIIGIGLNVNQLNFDNLPQASSMAKIAHTFFDKEELMKAIVLKMKFLLADLKNRKESEYWESYHQYLFMIGKTAVYENKMGKRFCGIIQKVSEEGKLLLLEEDDVLAEYDIKEIKMLY